MDIGKKIKEMRIALNLTQEELADRVGLSKGFISQMEHNSTSPSISTLEDILTCLGVSLADFFAEKEEQQIVFKKEDHFKKEDCELKNIVRWVVPTAQKCMMEPVCLVLEPGGSTQKDLPHEGEEFGYVIKGKVNVHYGNRSFVAGKGESFYYTSEKTHYLSSDSGAIMLWVSAPPSF